MIVFIWNVCIPVIKANHCVRDNFSVYVATCDCRWFEMATHPCLSTQLNTSLTMRVCISKNYSTPTFVEEDILSKTTKYYSTLIFVAADLLYSVELTNKLEIQN